jgi:very-short-patch-repair endonuclease
MTDAERKLWGMLREGRFDGCRFRRQVPMGAYIADFVCHDAKLVIEVDGGQHNLSSTSEERRTTFLESQGYRVIRFWNNEVLSNLDGVHQVIAGALGGHHPHPPARARATSPIKGEGKTQR